MEPNEKIDLKPGGLARPMDRNAMSNDMGTLRNILGMLNNPLITGAKPPVEEPVEVEAKQEGPAQSGFRLPKGCRKLFLTGAPKSGKSWLSAQVGAHWVELDDPIRLLASEAFGTDARPESLEPFIHEVFSIGEGLVSQKYPLTASRALYVEWMRSRMTDLFHISPKTFGTSGFWTNSLIARTKSFLKDFPKELVVTTGVETPEQYKALRSAGFAAVHVMCNNITRSGRGANATISSLVTSIERDITQKLSQQQRGPKLWAVWCDDKYPTTSGRLLTIQEFVQGVSL